MQRKYKEKCKISISYSKIYSKKLIIIIKNINLSISKFSLQILIKGRNVDNGKIHRINALFQFSKMRTGTGLYG